MISRNVRDLCIHNYFVFFLWETLTLNSHQIFRCVKFYFSYNFQKQENGPHLNGQFNVNEKKRERERRRKAERKLDEETISMKTKA